MTEHSLSTERQWAILRNQLTAARKRSMINQDDVAEHVGCARNHIGRVERGEADPTLTHLLKHAEALDLTVALVPPYLARLVGLSVQDITAIVQAAACANRRVPLSAAQQARLLVALVKINPTTSARLP